MNKSTGSDLQLPIDLLVTRRGTVAVRGFCYGGKRTYILEPSSGVMSPVTARVYLSSRWTERLGTSDQSKRDENTQTTYQKLRGGCSGGRMRYQDVISGLVGG